MMPFKGVQVFEKLLCVHLSTFCWIIFKNYYFLKVGGREGEAWPPCSAGPVVIIPVSAIII